jgi:leader peptidase (prepilin peptidase)/N-methyltransferase
MIILVFLIALCWGSFLNVVGYRIIRGKSLFGRSKCPYCKTPISWYDLIPVLSWLMLKGRCRECKKPISILYPLIELLTALIFSLMVLYINPRYWLGYGIFFSSLIVTIRTDFERMLISRYMTWGLIPVGIGLTIIDLLPITFYQSLTGTILGYALLWISATFFRLVRRAEGIGEGDLDLLAMVGAFIGPLGAWVTLFLGSFLGSLVGFIVMIRKRRVKVKIAFGPWLAAGAIIYVFTQDYFVSFFFH